MTRAESFQNVCAHRLCRRVMHVYQILFVLLSCCAVSRLADTATPRRVCVMAQRADMATGSRFRCYGYLIGDVAD